MTDDPSAAGVVSDHGFAHSGRHSGEASFADHGLDVADVVKEWLQEVGESCD